MPPLPQIQLGPGCATALGPLLDQLNADPLFIVADPQAYAASGARALFAPALEKRRTIVFDRFDPTPKLEDVEAALTAYRTAPAQAILAVVKRHVPDFDDTALGMKSSKKGKYLSVTCVIRATSREQLDALYQELCDLPMVVMVL